MPLKLLNLGRTLLCMVSNDAYFRALSSGTDNSKTRTYDLFTRERRYIVTPIQQQPVTYLDVIIWCFTNLL